MYIFLIVYLIFISYLFALTNIPVHLFRLKFGNEKYNFEISGLWLFVILTIVPLIWCFSNRSFSVGSDTYGIYYQIYYLGYVINNWSYSVYEGLFIWFLKILNQINWTLFDTPILFKTILLCILTMICGTFVHYFYKNKEKYNTVIAILVFFIWLFLPSLNIMRQILAVTVSFWGTILLEKNRFKLSLLIFIMAIFIHISAVVMLIFPMLYLLRNRKINKEKLPIFVFMISIVLMLGISIITKLPFFSKFESQIGSFSLSNLNFKFFIFPTLMIIPIYPKYKILINKSKYNYIYLSGIGLIFSSILLSGYLWFAFRIMYYFIPSGIIIISQLGKYYSKSNRIIINIYFILITILTFYVIYVVYKVDGIYPYVGFN